MNELPPELLLKIFSYLPDHKNVALVNHRFHDAVCTLDGPLFGLFPELWEEKEHKKDDILRSIMNTSRTIRNMMVSFLVVERPVVIDVLKKFGENIHFLRVCGDQPSDLIEAVSMVPNAIHLELVLRTFNVVRSSKLPRLDIQNNDEELKMLRLRKLNIERSKHEFLEMFNRLPPDVLIELSVHQDSLHNVVDLFRRQTNIKKLTIENRDDNDDESYKNPIIRADLFDHLRLESLEWHAYTFKNKNIGTILAKQVNLKVLKLIDGKISVDIFNVITNQLTKLETLWISISRIPVDAVKSIAKLQNLKELTLQSDKKRSVLRFNEFATLDNSRITSLNIQHLYNMSNDLIKAMANSMPNLKNVSFHCAYDVDIFHAILKNFNYVEALHLDTLLWDIDDEERKGRFSTLMKSGCKNDKLIELEILYPMSYAVKLVQKLIMDYPNLKKLIIVPTNRTFGKQYEAILKGFKEMQSFSIRNISMMNERFYDLELVLKYGTNLKFVALLDIHDHIIIENNIKKKFGVIKYSKLYGLKMAVDRRTMETES